MHDVFISYSSYEFDQADYVTDDLGNCVLNENTWSSDYNALMQKIDENYAEIERLSKLFQNESALIEQLESEEVG